jgi:hypothetical protein
MGFFHSGIHGPYFVATCKSIYPLGWAFGTVTDTQTTNNGRRKGFGAHGH